MAKVHFKPGYFASGIGLQNKIHQDTFSTKIFKFYNNEQETDSSRRFGITGVVEEIIKKERVVFEQLIPCGKKRQRLSPCNPCKNVEPVHFLSPFQNRKPFSVKQIIQEED